MSVNPKGNHVYSVIRLVMLSDNIAFSRKLKQSLEHNREFAVQPFTARQGLYDVLHIQLQDIFIIDADYPNLDVVKTLQAVRDIQPDIAITLMTRNKDWRLQVKALDLRAVVSRNIKIRELIPILKKTLPTQDNLADTSPLNTSEQLVGMNDGKDNTLSQSSEPLSVESLALFQQLAAEEPPLPGHATVSDFIKKMQKSGQLGLSLTQADESETITDDAIPASLILDAVTDDSTPIDGFSLSQFMENIKSQMDDGDSKVMPLPSWVEEHDRYIREPDFLPRLPNMSDTLEYTATTTTPSIAQNTEFDLPNMVTERQYIPAEPRPPELDNVDSIIENPLPDDSQPTIPPPSLPDLAPPPPAKLPEIKQEELSSETFQQEYDLADIDVDLLPSSIDEEIPPAPDLLETDNAYFARIAVALTQISLELTASATVLSVMDDAIAIAGEMPQYDVELLRQYWAIDWSETTANDRIQYGSLPSSGQDILIYSTPTVGDLTLSLIFVGAQKLATIRRQASRVSDALDALPDITSTLAPVDIDAPPIELPDEYKPHIQELPIEPEPILEQELDSIPIPTKDWGPRLGYTFLWLVEDPDQFPIDDTMKPLLLNFIKLQYQQQGWLIEHVDIQDDYMSLYAEIPGEDPSTDIIRDVMRLTGDLMRGHYKLDENTYVWSDSYLVLMPARELEIEEIQSFIHFARIS